jgi:hypothetical protein
LAAADKDAAGTGTQRKDVAGAREIVRFRSWIHGYANGMGAIVGGDAGGDSFSGINGFAKRGAETGRVHGRHGLEFEAIAGGGIDGQTDKAAAMSGHEVYGFRGDFIGRQREVAFIFAILIIHYNQNFSLPKILNGFGHGSKGQSARLRQ